MRGIAGKVARTEQLCHDCVERLQRSPLRLLDCKQPTCKAMAQEAPRTVDHLCPGCRDHWEKLLSYLQRLGVPFTVDPGLVRGLGAVLRNRCALVNMSYG